MRHTYLLNFYLSKIRCKRPQLNIEPTHILTLMNNGKAFSNLDGMACSYRCPDQFQLLPGYWQAKRYWISWDLKKVNSFKNNLNNTSNNMKSQIQNKKNGGTAELLIPTLNNVIRNQGTYFIVIMNNRLKINEYKWCSLYMGGFFPKKNFSWGDRKFFGQTNYEIVLNRRTNDQIMPRFGRSFMNDKCIFQ